MILPLNQELPVTVSFADGDEEPTPTFPLAATVNSEVPVEEATLSGLTPGAPCTLNVYEDEVALIPATVPLSRNIELRNDVPFHLDINPFERDDVSDVSENEEASPRDDVDTADTAPFVPHSRPLSDATDRPPVVVVEVTARVPVAVMLPPI